MESFRPLRSAPYVVASKSATTPSSVGLTVLTKVGFGVTTGDSRSSSSLTTKVSAPVIATLTYRDLVVAKRVLLTWLAPGDPIRPTAVKLRPSLDTWTV